MPHGKYKGRDMVCPFWRGEGEKHLACEGMEAGMKTIVCFASKGRKASYAARRCKDLQGYKACRYAQVLMKKYEGE